VVFCSEVINDQDSLKTNGIRIIDPDVAAGAFSGTLVNPSDTFWRKVSVTVRAMTEEHGDMIWEHTFFIGDVPPGTQLSLTTPYPQDIAVPGHITLGIKAAKEPPAEPDMAAPDTSPKAKNKIEIRKQRDGVIQLFAE
jgi:hypothetical protein